MKTNHNKQKFESEKKGEKTKNQMKLMLIL